jgi:hypothetical protein
MTFAGYMRTDGRRQDYVTGYASSAESRGSMPTTGEFTYDPW